MRYNSINPKANPITNIHDSKARAKGINSLFIPRLKSSGVDLSITKIANRLGDYYGELTSIYVTEKAKRKSKKNGSTCKCQGITP